MSDDIRHLANAKLRNLVNAKKRIRELEAALKWLLWLHNDDLHGTTPVASEAEWDEAWETAAELVEEPPR